MLDQSTAGAAASEQVSASRSHEDTVAALYAWELHDPEDQEEFARNDDYVRELADEAEPFLGRVRLDAVRAELSAEAGSADWRELCESRARELFPEAAGAAEAAASAVDDAMWRPVERADDDADVWC